MIKDGILLDRSNRVFVFMFNIFVSGGSLDDEKNRGPFHLRYTVPYLLYRLTDGPCVHLNRGSNRFRGDRVIDPYLLKWLKQDTNMIDGDILEIFTEICEDNFKTGLIDIGNGLFWETKTFIPSIAINE